MRKIPVLCVVLFLFAGCASQGGGWNPLKAWFGRKAAAEARTEAKVDKAEDATVKAAQKEVEKAKVAVGVASTEHPESRSVEVAKRTIGNASNLLNQRSPLTVAELEEAVATANGLLSVETAKREDAEKRQAATERENRSMSEELGALRAKLADIGEQRKAEAAANLETANELRAANLRSWGLGALNVVLAVGVFAYRANFLGLATKVAGGLADLEKSKGPETADLARGALDVALDTGEKTKIFAALSRIAPAIAHRVSTS